MYPNIREAQTSDASELSSLIRHAYRDVADQFELTATNCPKHPSNCTDGWVENDFSRGVRYFILEKEHKSVGCAAIEMAGHGLCYLERLAVLPSERHKGNGQQLVEHVFQEARKLNIEKISIGIINQQTELKQWYKKMGFVEGEIKEFEHLPFCVCFMTIDLRQV